eukprot:15485046-Alexandrium_andersonii.AAC.1
MGHRGGRHPHSRCRCCRTPWACCQAPQGSHGRARCQRSGSQACCRDRGPSRHWRRAMPRLSSPRHCR